MDIINVIDRLDALLNTSPKVPTTRSRLVDAEKVMELVEQLRLAIPQDIRASQEVIDRKDTIINQAQIEARHTREQAEDEFKARLDENELLVAARNRAEQLTDESESKAARHTREQAEDEFKARLDENELLVAARNRAEQLTDESESKAARLIQAAEADANRSQAEADIYVVQALRNLETELNTVLTTVRKGLDTIGATVQV
jgi:hypothetical protein